RRQQPVRSAHALRALLMLILDNANRKLEIVLTAAVATSELSCVWSYAVTTDTEVTAGAALARSNGTTPVAIVTGGTDPKTLRGGTVTNPDTAQATLQLRYNDNGTYYPIVAGVTLQPGETL